MSQGISSLNPLFRVLTVLGVQEMDLPQDVTLGIYETGDLGGAY
jgi:hypothetical protein